MASLLAFWRDECGQDNVEYALLIAFITVVCAALMLTNQTAINTIWGITVDNLDRGGRIATGET